MPQEFKDLFSAQAADYAKFRPHYPKGLFDYLATLTPERNLAWDVGCGNGQATTALAEYFYRVIGTDPSEAQLKSAVAHPKVEYRRSAAEHSGLEDFSANLITVGQAFHWFKQEEFFREVRRVAEPGGALAIWCYEMSAVDEDVDSVMMRLYRDVLGAFWDPERRLVEEGYRHEKVPFNEISPPPFELQAKWDLADYLGYLGTWSAGQKYKREHGRDPRELIADELREAWGDPHERKAVAWPISLRVFQVA